MSLRNKKMPVCKKMPVLIAAALGSANSFANGNSCSVHDHLCTYHALGRPITSYKQIDNDETRLVIYGRVLDTPDGKPVDFDNHVMLPTRNSETGDPTKPFVTSRTSYGRRNPSEVTPSDWERASDNPATEGAHVYPSQYQVIFNKNTAKARHSGDFNGGENGNIPNAVGCPGHTGSPKDCEAVIITGNVPSGIYSQKLHMFNHHKQENPEANIRMGAWATGQGVLVVKHHDPNFAMASVSEEQEVHGADVNLAGSKAQSQQVDYHFHNNGFNPHAAGTASWHHGFTHQRIKDGTYTQYNQHTNTIDTMQKIRNVYGHLTTTVQADGTASTRHHQRETFGEYVAGRKPVPKVAPTSSQDSGAKSGWGLLGSFFQPLGEFGNSLIKSVENNSMVQSTKQFVQQKISDLEYRLDSWEIKDISGTPMRCDKRDNKKCEKGEYLPKDHKDDETMIAVFGQDNILKHKKLLDIVDIHREYGLAVEPYNENGGQGVKVYQMKAWGDLDLAIYGNQGYWYGGVSSGWKDKLSVNEMNVYVGLIQVKRVDGVSDLDFLETYEKEVRKYVKDHNIKNETLGKKISDTVTQDGFSNGEGTIHDRFIKNIASGDREFKRDYSFRDNLGWAYGGGTFSGKFDGTVEHVNGGKLVEGKIKYVYSDEFQDALDIFNMFPGRLDLIFEPYKYDYIFEKKVKEFVPN